MGEPLRMPAQKPADRAGNPHPPAKAADIMPSKGGERFTAG
jgi:hypothetical protein